jgi:hypothetical protein
VIGTSSPTKQPNIDARSLMTAVINPITAKIGRAHVGCYWIYDCRHQ